MDQNELTAVAGELAKMLAARTGVPTQAPAGPWAPGAPATGTMPATADPRQPQALLLRVTVPMPDGTETSGYLAFDPAIVTHPQALAQVVQTYGIRTFAPKPTGWGQQGGNGGGYSRGGYGGGGGGYGGGYSGRRGWR